VGGVDDIKTQEEYMRAVENAARRYHDQKIVPDKSMDIQSPAPYNTWFLSRFYKSNVLAIYDQLYGQKNEGR
ncbi:MAG TPA: hypothetical protein VJ508_20665, partial [Saprospiraceae bacterium]|nr:hypothetical protein [Saprospiraceae bacterium]